MVEVPGDDNHARPSNPSRQNGFALPRSSLRMDCPPGNPMFGCGGGPYCLWGAMMADHRTIDAELWTDRKLRRLPLQARYLYAALISTYADDEGRFVADVEDMQERLFTRSDAVSVEQVQDWLEALVGAGVVLLYVNEDKSAEDTYGFLMGWFKRQVLPKRYRTPSSLPPPPMKVNSWQRVDMIHETIKKRENRDRMASTQAVRLFTELSEEEQQKVCPDLTEDYVTLAQAYVKLRGKGREGIGKEGEVRTIRTEGTTTTPRPPISRNPNGNDHDPDADSSLVDRCLNALGDLADQGGARMTVENVIASHALAPEVVLPECIALRARADEGQRVHLSFLARNVSEACRRLQGEQDSEDEAIRERTAALRELDERLERERAEQEARARADPWDGTRHFSEEPEGAGGA